MMMRVSGLGAAVICGCASSALGQIHLTLDSRYVSAAATASNASGTANSGPSVKAPAAFGAAFDDNAQAGVARIGASAAASTSQISEILAGRITGQGSFSASALVTTGLSATASVANVLDLAFRLDAGTTWEMQGSTSGAAEFRLIGPDGTVLLQNLGVASGTVTTTGIYRIVAGGTGEASRPLGESGYGGGYSFIFTAVPTPGTVGVMVGMLMVAGRRRR